MDTQHFKQTLEAEQKKLERELGELGFKNSEGEWEAIVEDFDAAPPQSEEGEAANKIEDYEQRRAESAQLQARWTEVKHALEKIDNGKYGLCEVDNEPIEEARLKANPAARTCEAHM